MNKKAIYTCITGGYDKLSDPRKKIDGYDYICFTDRPELVSECWIVKSIPEELKNLDKAKQSKVIKICPHRYLSEYEMSIWFDGNIKLDFDFDGFINKFIDEHSVYVKRHPARNCIYDELKICINMRKDNEETMRNQVERYKKENFPSKYGLSENNFIVRFHNRKDCITLMENWCNEVINGSKRDQLSFMYCVWKTNTSIKIFETNHNIRVFGHNGKK